LGLVKANILTKRHTGDWTTQLQQRKYTNTEGIKKARAVEIYPARRGSFVTWLPAHVRTNASSNFLHVAAIPIPEKKNKKPPANIFVS
jgi:hypothetical protein